MTEAVTRKQAVVSYIVAEKDKNKTTDKPNPRKAYDTIYELPNDPATGDQLYGLPCVWQGSDHTQVSESEIVKITGRLNWAFAKTTIGGYPVPITRFYVVWEIPLAGSEMATGYETDSKEAKPSADAFIQEFQILFANFNRS